ncbi:MAG: VWA domain-containing protein [Phycisphaerales bacterium]|nr:VWA domain-containing protein [Planctomycetota bacterium]
MNQGDFTLVLGAASWRFENPSVLLLLALLPLIGPLLWMGFLRRMRGVRVFEGATPEPTRPSTSRGVLKLCLICLGLSSLVVAIARPQSDPIEESVTIRGRDLVFLVDVSRSMLSRDLVPSRLARAKLWINDLVNTLKGDRVGLVAFAGVPVVKCPLTLDYGYFRMELDDLSPASVPRGGTLIGDAIRKTLSDVMEPGDGRYRDIILITDGEDQGSFPAEAAKTAADLGVRIIAIGIGSELEGALVPADEKAGSNYLEHDGAKIRSKMDGSTLRAIAAAASPSGGTGGGVFLNVGTGTIDLDQVYHDLISNADQRETQATAAVQYRELFPFFLAVALACLGLEPMISERSGPTRLKVRLTPAAAAILFSCLLSPAARAQPTSPEAAQTANPPAPPKPQDLYNQGRQMYLSGKYDQAAEAFRAADMNTSDPELAARSRFNLGQSLLKQATVRPDPQQAQNPAQSIEKLKGAEKAFRAALDVNPADEQAARNVEIARRLLNEQQQQRQQQDQKQQNQQKSGDGKNSGDKSDSKQDTSDQTDQNKQAQQHQKNADDLKDLAQKQSRAADKSNQAAAQPDPEKKKESTQESRAQQQEVSEQTKREQQKQQADSDLQEKLKEAEQQQQQASEALDRQDPKKAEEHQRKSAELLDQAAKEEQAKADKAREQAAKEEANKKETGKEQAKAGKPKEESPPLDQTASQLLDRERAQREARQQVLRAMRGKPQPVEKDW